MQEAKRRNSAMLRPALAVCCGLQLLSSIPTANGTSAEGARRTIYYQDADCRLETFREFVFEAISVDTDGTTSQVGFGECYARGSTGAIATCDTTNRTSTVETYLDTSCQVHLYSSVENAECKSLQVEGDTCPPGGPSSTTTDCVGTESVGTIHPGAFNLIGSPYADMNCQKRTGGDQIVSGHAFGVGSGECSLSPLVRGPRHALTECREDDTLYAQVFAPEDSTCVGDVRLEMLMFRRAKNEDRTGGMCALGHFEDGRQEYYRLKACTTEEETPRNDDIGPTPAPTRAADSSDGGAPHADPAPVDYRGDGDDEDLRDDSEDSSSSGDGDSEDAGVGGGSGGGSGSSSSSSGHHKDDDTDMEDSSSEKDDKDVDSEDDSGEDGSTQGGKDSGDGCSGGCDDGVTDDSVFAIAFGVTVSVVTCCLAGLLAFAGSGNDKNKVGPKTDG